MKIFDRDGLGQAINFYQLREEQLICPDPGQLNRDIIHLYFFLSDAPWGYLREIKSGLSIDEWIKGASFRFSKDRHRFLWVRSVLRQLLAPHLGIRPHEVRFSCNAWGKPILTGARDGEGVSFNLSHAHQFACIALTSGQRIGVDLEYIRPVPECEEIVRTNFTAREYHAMVRRPQAERQEFFFTLWSKKEAFIKATGEGLSRALSSFEVQRYDISPRHGCANQYVLIQQCRLPGEMISSFIPAPGYVGAVATANPFP